MHKFGVQLALEEIRDARARWSEATKEFNQGAEFVLVRLIHEAARNYMSVEDVSKFSGLSTKRVRALMREVGLNPRDGKNLLSKKAAEALNENAALMGIDPSQMDLMSPLAYLPMGKALRDKFQTQTTAPLDGAAVDAALEEDSPSYRARLYAVAFLLWQIECGYIKAEDRAVSPENWMLEDPRTMHPDDAESVPGFLDAAREVIAVVSGNTPVPEPEFDETGQEMEAALRNILHDTWDKGPTAATEALLAAGWHQ